MAKFDVDLTGDAALKHKIDQLGSDLNRWMFNRAFKPAVLEFVDPIISRIHHVKRRLGAKKNIRARAMRRSRKMVGVRLTSKFGTTQPDNDPYYGAFVNWGHEIVLFGYRTGKRTKPQRFMERAFEATQDRAATKAVMNLKSEIETAWGKRTGSSGTT